MAIAQTMSNLFKSDAEIYALARGLALILWKLKQDHKMLKDLEEIYHKIMASYNGKLYSHMEKIGLNHDLPLRTWLLQGYSGALSAIPLQRVWDKVIGGSLVILPYVAVSMVDTAISSIMGCQTSKEALRCLKLVRF